MKWSSMVVLIAAAVVLGSLWAQEQPAAQPAATPGAKAGGQPAATPVAAPTDDVHQKMVEVAKKISTLERDARKNDPTIATKLQDLEKQRRQIFVQARPELEALYAEQDASMEKARAAWGKAAGGKAMQNTGAKAERKAEKQAEKAAKAEPKQ